MCDVIRGVSKSVDFRARYSMFSGGVVARSILLLSRHFLDIEVNFFRNEYTVVRSQLKLSPMRDSRSLVFSDLAYVGCNVSSSRLL